MDATAKETAERAANLQRKQIRRRWIRRGVLLLALLGAVVEVAVGLAPGYVERAIETRLGERLGTEVEVDSVEIDYGHLVVTIVGLRFDDGKRLAVEVPEIDVDLSWLQLVRLDAAPSVVVHEPRVAIELDQRVDAQPQPRRDPRLDGFESIEVVDGTLAFTLVTHSGPSALTLEEIDARLETPLREGPAHLMTTVHADADLADGGHLALEGRVSSEAPRDEWRMRFDVSGFDVTTFNNLWRDIIEMDADRGHLDVKGELLRSAAHLRGRIRPHFEDLAMLGPHEKAAHPMAEALFSHMLTSARTTIPVNRPIEDGKEIALTQLLQTDWRTLLSDMIRKGYARRLDTLVGYTAEIGEVNVDFDVGLIVLEDVTLINESREVDEPFVVVPRIDVVFDPEVTEEGARAYKHVTLWEPKLTFIVGDTGESSQIKFDERWVDKISAIPFQTRDLDVHKGRIEYKDYTEDEPIHMWIDGLELEGREMAKDLHAPGSRGARLSGSAHVMGTSVVSIDVAYEPKAPVPNLDLDLVLLPLPMELLNPLLRTYADVEATAGDLGFEAHITARDLDVTATVQPDIMRPRLDRPSDAGRGHRLRHIMLERRLKKLRGRAIELDYRMEPQAGVLEGFFPEFLMAVISQR